MPSVLDRAQNFSGGPVAAARQRDRWALREANATDAETREQYREAIADLQARYPDLEDVPIGGAEAFARERGHGTGKRSPVHGGRRRPGAGGSRGAPAAKKPKTPPAAQGKPKDVPGLTPGAGSTRRAKGAPTPRVDRAIRQTGIPAAFNSGGSTVMAALGATVGLALLFLVLSSAETPGSGAAALPRVIGWDRKHESVGVLGFLGRFLDPHRDIFSPSHASSESAANEPVYDEGPGSDIAIAAERLKAAGPTRRQKVRRERRRRPRPQGHVHR